MVFPLLGYRRPSLLEGSGVTAGSWLLIMDVAGSFCSRRSYWVSLRVKSGVVAMLVLMWD